MKCKEINHKTLIAKYKEELQNYNYQGPKKLQNFNYQVKRKITKV